MRYDPSKDTLQACKAPWDEIGDDATQFSEFPPD
jgi:hypothetical protein